MRRLGSLPGHSARAAGGGGRRPLLLLGVIALLVLLVVLFLPPVGLLRSEDSGDSDGLSSTTRSEIPELPEGLEAVSPLYELKVPPEALTKSGVRVTLKLSRALEKGSNVNLYTHREGRYRRLAAAELNGDGSMVTAVVEALPENVIALRRITFGLEAHGWLPADTELDEVAGRALAVLNPVDWAPGEDGQLQPLGNARPLGGQFRIIPTIRDLTSEAANTILTEDELREGHIQDIVFTVESGAFDGIDIDYRGVSEAARTEFARFITALADELHKGGKLLSVTLPFPEVDEAGVVDTGPYDWQAIGLAADYVKILPQRNQDRYQRDMRAVLQYATENIDPTRVLLVLSPYAGERTPDGITLRTLGEAMALATAIEVKGDGPVLAGSRVNIVAPRISQDAGASGLLWSEDSLSVEFTWPEEGGNHTIWIENQFSAAFKLQLVKEFGLAGVAVEDVADNPYGADLWPAVLAFLEDGEPTLLKPNGELLGPQWESDAGTLQGGSGGVVTWQAPARPGTYALALILSDGVVRMATRLDVEVEPRAGEASPTPGEDEEATGTPTPRRRRESPTPTP